MKYIYNQKKKETPSLEISKPSKIKRKKAEKNNRTNSNINKFATGASLSVLSAYILDKRKQSADRVAEMREGNEGNEGWL